MSLRDQLLKAGLVTEKQAREAAQQQRQQTRLTAHSMARSQPRPPSPQQLAVSQAQARKAAYDQELNRKKQEKAERKARRAQVNQLVEQCRVPKLESDDYFNFVHDNTVERICVDAPTREKIARGELIIVRYRGHFALLPNGEAQRIRDVDPTAIVAVGSVAPANIDPDDPYREFVVPDDLVW